MIDAGETDLTGKVWPVHLKPQQDELLSSWLTRLALAHGQTVAAFTNLVWLGRVLVSRELDLWNDPALFETLSSKTNTPQDEVFATTLTSYQGRLWEETHQSHAPWLLARHVNVRPQKHFGLQFCPCCLAADAEPYFRRHCRLACVVLCPLHRTLLLDRCQSCGTAVCYERQTVKALRKTDRWLITQCHGCNSDLRDFATHRYCKQVDSAELEFQVSLQTTLRCGWAELPRNGVIYSHLFFSGLHQIMGRLIYGRMAEPLKVALRESYGIDLPIDYLPDKSVFLERLNVVQRRALLQAVNRLLQDWPDSFIEFCQANKLASHFLIGDKKRLPFWYWCVVREHLTKSARKVSDQEIISIVHYARKEGGQTPAPELNQFLSTHIIKRARRAGLFEAKEKRHPGLCRHCQATQRQIKSGFSRHGTQQFRCGECGRIYQQDYQTGRKRPSTIQLPSEKNGCRIVSGGSLP